VHTWVASIVEQLARCVHYIWRKAYQPARTLQQKLATYRSDADRCRARAGSGQGAAGPTAAYGAIDAQGKVRVSRGGSPPRIPALTSSDPKLAGPLGGAMWLSSCGRL
jgi:hypothetical protein